MVKILCIDTSLETASIGLSINGESRGLVKHAHQMDHAGWLQPAIRELIQAENLRLQDLDAIAVGAGPGSYTGLRVGMASAKGLCYALNKPLISFSTLEMMARGIKGFDGLLCPMIDARRMEVFFALYDRDYQLLEGPSNLVLDQASFGGWLKGQNIAFFGSGAAKYSEIVSNGHAFFPQFEPSIGNIAHLVYEAYKNGKFADLAYMKPFYVKAFHSTQSRARL